MTENTNEEEFSNKVKKHFITNSIFGQKLINSLSHEKKKEITIDYFLSHIKIFNKLKKENYEEKIDYKKFIDRIPQNIQSKLKNESDIVIKNRYCIEPYCKKQLKIITPINSFKKFGFHYKLLKLDSIYYDLLGIIYYNDNIVGYISCGKKPQNSINPLYKSIFVFLSLKYEKDFFDNNNKKLSIINEITEEISFYEKNTYNKYLKNFRNQFNSILLEILLEFKNIKNIICIGEEEGGNILQLLLIDLINNKDESNLSFPKELYYYLFTHNTAMLSTETFYNDLIKNLGGNNNSIITCFDEKNEHYKSWNIDEINKKRYNFFVLDEENS